MSVPQALQIGDERHDLLVLEAGLSPLLGKALGDDPSLLARVGHGGLTLLLFGVGCAEHHLGAHGAGDGIEIQGVATDTPA
jgi:hypothetical protein